MVIPRRALVRGRDDLLAGRSEAVGRKQQRQLVENLHAEESERIVISYEALLDRRD